MERAAGSQRAFSGPSRPLYSSAAGSAAGSSHVLIALVLISFLIPSSFEVVGLRLDAMRVTMLAGILPCTLIWLSRKAGAVTWPDLLILGHAVWIIVSFVVNHGMPRFPYASMLAIEFFCGFLFGRLLIRDRESFRAFFSIMAVIFIVLTPFAVYELFTGKPIMQEIARSVFGNAHGDVDHPSRLGMKRVQSVLQNPILWGVFASMSIANAWYIWRPRPASAFFRSLLALWVTFSSLSSGAVLAGLVQVVLMGWDILTKGAWKVVAYGSAALYVFLEVASNRGPVVLMIETLTFNPDTGWWRIHQWRNGTDDVMNNPIFGIGLHDWTRPFWLSDSVDNFWLLTAMRHGLVGFGLLAGGIGWHLYKVLTAPGLSEEEKRFRTGYVIGLVSLCLSLATVHIWGPTYVAVMMYVGAGAWFYAGRSPSDPATAQPGAGSHSDPEREADEPASLSRYSRFDRTTRRSRGPSRATPTTGRLR